MTPSAMCAALMRSRTTRSTAASPPREFSPITPPVSHDHGASTPLARLRGWGSRPVQVVLALAVPRSSRGNAVYSRRAPEHHPVRGRPRGSRGRRRRVDALHHLHDARALPHDAAVAAGLLQLGRGDGGGGAGATVPRSRAGARPAAGTGSKSPFATSTSAPAPRRARPPAPRGRCPSCFGCSTKTGAGVDAP